MAKLVSPSILAADFNKLGEEIEIVNNSEADWIHFDVMDGVFVPNISFGFPILTHVKKIAKKPLDVHLMIREPDRYLIQFKDVGADILTVHTEACIHLHRTVQVIKKLGMKAGVALNPHTPINVLESIITDLDMVLIMAVNPGFGGQTFIPESLNRVERLCNLIEKKNCNTIVQLDGGVSLSNAKEIVDAGVDCLVSGSAIFGADDKYAAIKMFKEV